MSLLASVLKTVAVTVTALLAVTVHLAYEP
jgi:hypothetical protein